ncbi:hypothetical protein [Tenacibaculum ovolyticum]|uniref:hypothetical protein n=1 Tax=Tenacibaculum ovolyticum TaxID=104270 RepID=UPI001F207615|nr:hypothetical protein [Tenacibaculum ovolyticum]
MYEFLIATGRSHDASTDKTVEMALIYNNAGNEYTSDYFKPGDYSNRKDAYENGQLDICANIEVKKDGKSIDTDDFIGVKIKFYDKTWELDTIWVTNQNGGRCRFNKVNKFFGTDSGIGTEDNPFRIDFELETLSDTDQNTESFKMEVTTADGGDTDDNVYYKLFDDTGHASKTSRADLPGDQYEGGETNTIPSFDTYFGLLSKNITHILIIKVGNDKWVPEYIIITEILGSNSQFNVIDHLPPEGSLDTNHNWTSVPEKVYDTKISKKKEVKI